MKFTCEKGLLQAACATASRATASKSPIPALEGLLIEAKGDVKITGYDLLSHEFTHIDSPHHHTPDGVDLDAYPLQDWAITDCLILDVSYVGDNEEITAAMLEKANEPFKDKHFDTLIIRSDRPKKVSRKGNGIIINFK